ncbi:MAG: hypothetical protein ABI844_12470 [Saprospiraceae bacterium]
METEKELNAKIIELTLKIWEQHPELSKLLDEMPLTIPNESSPEITIKKLNEYFESLDKILKGVTQHLQ